MELTIGPYRVVDLTMPLDPATCTRRLALRRFLKEDTRDYHTDMDLTSHLGTHVESPFHYNSDWKDIAGLPVTAYMGRGVLLDLKDIASRAPITGAELDAADQGRVREGDVCVLTSPYHCVPFSNDPNDQRPYLCRESGEWFARKEVKSIAFGDGVAIEYSVETACDVHEVVMPMDITFIEVLQNIDQLHDDVFFIVFQPIPIKGLDSCPVRVVAIEGIPGFCPEDSPRPDV